MPADNYQMIMREIAGAAQKSGRSAEDVRLIAVTKTVGMAEVQSAATLGIGDFGENRVQDAAEKVRKLSALRWHFIGHLQSNKVKDVLPYYCLIHSLDRSSLAAALQNCAEKLDLVAAVLIQVNVSGEQSKFGIEPDRLPGFIEEVNAYDRLKIRGLMTMAPFVDDSEEARPHFRRLRLLREANQKKDLEMPELSMGMTNDYIVAVEEGATMVRIGSALFRSPIL